MMRESSYISHTIQSNSFKTNIYINITANHIFYIIAPENSIEYGELIFDSKRTFRYTGDELWNNGECDSLHSVYAFPRRRMLTEMSNSTSEDVLSGKATIMLSIKFYDGHVGKRIIWGSKSGHFE